MFECSIYCLCVPPLSFSSQKMTMKSLLNCRKSRKKKVVGKVYVTLIFGLSSRIRIVGGNRVLVTLKDAQKLVSVRQRR